MLGFRFELRKQGCVVILMGCQGGFMQGHNDWKRVWGNAIAQSCPDHCKGIEQLSMQKLLMAK